ncbi:transcription mediator subunit Med12 [Plectosphaerella plurivora]|uniref:Mediator of RNA polymerase II transcription subunit 12 n=1 Tax=Plectosphaerella plurivora TaxID=936078 RepID=A0A9P9A5C0_9PEZI|nr:transcription mediator subunit Med12 [Plectosphaerella plurivora]
MNSRTPMGVQPPRPPQRSLSSGLTVQRPPHQRTLSAQYLPQSPIRRENLVDLTADANDAAVAQNRYGTLPRRGGSRLKLELSNDPSIFQPAVESPQSFTPSRAMPMPMAKTETSGLADMASPMSARTLHADSDNPPMPMPRRRQRFVLATPVKATQTPVIAIKKDGRPKAYSVETPTDAPRYAPLHKKPDAAKPGYQASLSTTKPTQQMGFADFVPWTGNHAEDQLSDSIIKQGYFDKAPVTQTETTSAKAAIFPALKHKNGLNLLSNIFVGVMNQRKHNGQVTAPSAFKPPPRVTLTDTKREAWMKDLANPAISLRRLSRTIPHGIRGKGLLDHCLSKNIPTERAIWLVRCVGANDLRTVKRKGVNNAVVVGGETKWLKEWTGYVEQFVESVTSSFGDADWRSRVQYAIRLATHLYAESLVDQDHYMDWLVSSLENSSQAKLPMWILVTQIYWKDLLRLRRYGRRLVAGLLTHLNTIHQDPDRDILAPLAGRLSSLLLTLLCTSPDNFLCPTVWLKCRDALYHSIPVNHDTAQAAFKWLSSRNEKLLSSNGKSQPANRQIMIKHLDSTFQTLMTPELATACWTVSEDKAMITRTALDWCTSFYRHGSTKVYVVASLFRTWAQMGVDVTAAVLEFLDVSPPQDAKSKRSFYQLAAELTRTGHFQPPAYTLWLISRGGLRNPSQTEPDAQCSTRLLVELPLQYLTPAFKETRANLLRRASYDVNIEAQDIETAIKVVDTALGISMSSDGDQAVPQLPLSGIRKRIGNSSRALQMAVGAHLVQVVGSDGLHMSPEMFGLIRSLLDAAMDYVGMAQVIKLMARSNNADVLASCADTGNVHLPVFAAAGAARDLCDMLLDRMKIVTGDHGITARPLLVALCSLTSQMPGLSNTAAHLRRDLQQSDRSTAIDACSPVSENMTARLQDAESDLQEEIEKLLINGSSVDKPTMDRLFHTIVSRLETCWSNGAGKQGTFSALLARLRLFDRQHFDVRMTDWVHHVSSLKARPSLVDIYPNLISLSCLSFTMILTTTSVEAAKVAAGPVQLGRTSTYMQEVLQLATCPLPPSAAVSEEEAYRFYIQQRLVLQQHQKELGVLVRNALVEYAKLQQQNADLTAAPLSKNKTQTHMLDLIRALVLIDYQSTSQALGVRLPDLPIGALLANVTTRLLAPANDPDVAMTFETVLEMASDFALPFCQLKLSIGLSSTRTSSPANGDEPQQPSQMGMLSKALNQAVDTKNMTWSSVLPYLSDEITEQLKKQSQARFLGQFPSPKTVAAGEEGAASPPSMQLTEGLLSVVEAIIRGRPALRVSQLNPTMVDKLTELWEVLASDDADKKQLRTDILQHWLPALLKYIILHTAVGEGGAPPTPAPANMKPPITSIATETRARMLVVLAGLTLELDGLGISEASSYRELRETIFDLGLFLADNLPEDARQQCVRLVIAGGNTQSTGSSDARLRYLFSAPPPWKEQFMLAHRQNPIPPTTGPARPRMPISVQGSQKLTPYVFRKWELLAEPSPVVGENDTALSLALFEAIKVQ